MNRRGFFAALAGALATATAFAKQSGDAWYVKKARQKPRVHPEWSKEYEGTFEPKPPCLCPASDTLQRHIVAFNWPHFDYYQCQCGGIVTAEEMEDGPHAKCCGTALGMPHDVRCHKKRAWPVTKPDCFDIGRMPDGTLVWLDR